MNTSPFTHFNPLVSVCEVCGHCVWNYKRGNHVRAFVVLLQCSCLCFWFLIVVIVVTVTFYLSPCTNSLCLFLPGPFPFSSLSTGMAWSELTLKPVSQQNSPSHLFYHDLNFKNVTITLLLDAASFNHSRSSFFSDHLGLPVVSTDLEACDHYISNLVKHISKRIKSDFLTPTKSNTSYWPVCCPWWSAPKQFTSNSRTSCNCCWSSIQFSVICFSCGGC